MGAIHHGPHATAAVAQLNRKLFRQQIIFGCSRRICRAKNEICLTAGRNEMLPSTGLLHTGPESVSELVVSDSLYSMKIASSTTWIYIMWLEDWQRSKTQSFSIVWIKRDD